MLMFTNCWHFFINVINICRIFCTKVNNIPIVVLYSEGKVRRKWKYRGWEALYEDR